MADDTYPLKLKPRLTPAIWGGDALHKHYGKGNKGETPIGESWECWDDNVVQNGIFSGLPLAELRKRMGSRLMGRLSTDQLFPVLTKIIDARQALSVQVHPNDKYAQQVEKQPCGKTECWYVLHADEGAELILGWQRDTDRFEYAKRVKEGTLGEILRRVSVSAGEAFYLPAGTLHAICGGIQLFEAQQACDLTYRIFDWNRVDSQGKSRPLHVDKAADVLEFKATRPSKVSGLSFNFAGSQRTLLIADARFAVEHLQMSQQNQVSLQTGNRPVVLMPLQKPLTITISNNAEKIEPYQTVIIPACADNFALSECSGAVLVVRPEPDLGFLMNEAAASGASAQQIAQFSKQFQQPTQTQFETVQDEKVSS